MDILKELRSQSKERRRSLAEEKDRQEMLERRYQTEIKPAMLSIMRYLDELVAHIRFVELKIPFQLDIPGYGPLTDLVLREQAVNADSIDNISKVTYRFFCATPGPLVFRVVPKTRAHECRDFLVGLRQKFVEWPIRDNWDQVIGLNFELELLVPVQIRFLADIETGRIVMTYTNFQEIGTRKLLIRASQVDQAWLNRLGAFILKRSDELVRLPVENEHLDAIRRKLHEENRARKHELNVAEVGHREQALGGRGEGLLGKLKTKIAEPEKKR